MATLLPPLGYISAEDDSGRTEVCLKKLCFNTVLCSETLSFSIQMNYEFSFQACFLNILYVSSKRLTLRRYG